MRGTRQTTRSTSRTDQAPGPRVTRGRRTAWVALTTVGVLAASLAGCGAPTPTGATPTTSVVATSEPGLAQATPRAIPSTLPPFVADPSAVAPPAASAAQPGTAATSPAPPPSADASPPGPNEPVAEAVLAASGLPAAGRDSIPSTGGVRLPATAPGPLNGRVIGIDPGHNGRQSAYPKVINAKVPAGNGKTKACNTTGTDTRAGYPEHAHNWAVATRAVTRLRALGATVIVTRPTNTGVGPCVNERAAIGNRAKADLVVSIHADGNDSRSARGFHVITSTTMAGGSSVGAASLRAANTLRDIFAARTGMPRSTYTGGAQAITRRTDIAGLNLSTQVAVMLEAGNLRHPTDAALLSSSAFQDKEAAAIVEAISLVLRR